MWQGPSPFFLVPPISVFGFNLMAQDGCLSTRYRVCITANRTEEGIKKGMSSPQQKGFQKKP